VHPELWKVHAELWKVHLELWKVQPGQGAPRTLEGAPRTVEGAPREGTTCQAWKAQNQGAFAASQSIESAYTHHTILHLTFVSITCCGEDLKLNYDSAARCTMRRNF
jgi:hypothetical protein